MNNKKQVKGTQLFGTKAISEHAGVESNIHHVKNVTVTYDRELFKNSLPRPLTVIRINIEFTDGIHETLLNHTMTLFADNDVEKTSEVTE
jgi:hypothetical protein